MKNISLLSFIVLPIALLSQICRADTLKIDFSDPSSQNFVLLTSFASVADDPDTKTKVLKIDTLKSEARWIPCFKTAIGILKPGTTYVLTAKCKIIEAVDDSYVLPLIRPFNSKNEHSDLGNTKLSRVGAWDRIFFRFHTPADVSDYSFQIHINKKVQAIVRDITLSECAPEKWESLGQNIAPTSLPGQLPKGADEFSIDLPQRKNDVVKTVVEFGASPSNADNTKAFNAALAFCAANGIGKLTVPKGVYRFTSDSPVIFDKLKDFEFDGQGATFVFLRKKRAISSENSLLSVTQNQRVLLKNFSLDWDWEQDPLGCYGKIESIEPSGEYADFRLIHYKKYPKQNIRIAMLSQVDPQTMAVGSENLFRMGLEFHAGRSPAAKYEWKEDNLLRIYAQSEKENFKKKLHPGMIFRIAHYYYDIDGISMKDNAHLTLSDINLYSCPGHGLIVRGDQNHWQFQRVNIVRPPGGDARPITCTADHFHVGQSGGYFKMEGCEFSFGADDAVNIHDCSAFGHKIAPRILRISNLSSAYSYYPGDSVEFRHADYSPAEFTSKIKSLTLVNQTKREYDMAFEDDLPEEKTTGFVIFNRRYGSHQVIIRNNYFHDFPRILFLTDNVTFEKNRVVHSMASGLKIETGYTYNLWSEGYGASNIVIRDNTFENINPMGRYPNEKQPAIYLSTYLKSDPSSEKAAYPILRNILIQGNSFKNFPGTLAYICSAENVFILNNTVENATPRLEPLPYRGGVAVEYSSNIFIKGNTWSLSKHMENPPLIVTPESVKEVHAWDNKLKK